MPSPLATIGGVKPATRSRAVELADQFPTLTVMWGYNPGPNEHGTGRALDLMVFQDTPLGNSIADYLWAHRTRLDVTHLIWRQRIRSTVVKPGVWRRMKDRGSVTENHMDHVHVLFGTRAFTPADADTNSTVSTLTSSAPPYPGVQLRRGSKGAHVRAVQSQLATRGWTIEVDGSYGPGTERVVRTFQQHKGLKADGVVGPATWAALWDLPVT